MRNGPPASRSAGWSVIDGQTSSMARLPHCRSCLACVIDLRAKLPTATSSRALPCAIANRHRVVPAHVIFGFAAQVGMLPLTGTCSPQHMREDLAIDLVLEAHELVTIDTAGERRGA